MSEEIDLFDELFERLAQPQSDTTPAQSALVEVAARLRSLKMQYAECLELNRNILQLSDIQFNMPRYDPAREAFVQEVDGKIVELFRLNRAEPDKPIEVQATAKISSFVPGAPQTEAMENDELTEFELQLSAKVEAFYFAASHWWRLFEVQLIERHKPEFIGVQMVRNKLITHADKTFASSESGYINSFGAGSPNGPVVKPTRFSDQTSDHQDAGLKPNLIEMLSIAIKRLSS